MKLTIATGIYPPEIGGPATYLKKMVPVFKKQGWDVDIITYGEPRTGVKTISRDHPFRWLAFLFAVLKSAKTSDAIYATDTFSSGLPASIAARILGKPFYLRFVGDTIWETARTLNWTTDDFDTFQNKKYNWNIEFLRTLQRFAIRRAHVITVSKYLQKIAKQWGVASRDITIIPNAVEPLKLPKRDTIRKQLQFDHQFVILTVGRITPYKGIDNIISMCAKLSKKIPTLKLVIVGDGPALDNAKKTAGKHNITHLVRFEGRKDKADVRKYMNAADAFVLNSEYEGMSHVLLEAMSVETPVIASNVCGNPELVKNRGQLFDYNNMQQLQEKLLNVYNNPDKWNTLAQKASKTLPTTEEVNKKTIQTLTS